MNEKARKKITDEQGENTDEKENLKTTGSESGETLEKQLLDARAQADSYYDQLVRLKAEFENYRKRMEREKENHRQFGKEEVFLKQIHLYDVIGSALEQINEKTPVAEIINGLKMIEQEFQRVLQSEGIQEIAAVGLFPDPNLHEVIAKISSSEPGVQPGQIIAVIQRGFMINGRLLRPAKVCIAEVENENSKNNSGGEI